MVRKSYCIVCAKEKKGIEVEDDFILDSIRWLKENVTHNVQNNKLVVCKDCYPRYKPARQKYESRQKMYLVLGVLFGMLILLISPRAATVLIAAVLVIACYILSLLSYTPKIHIKNQHTQ